MSLLEKHLDKYGHYYEGTALNIDQHFSLVEDLPKYSRQAGVQEQYIVQSALKWLKPTDVQWLEKFSELSEAGLVGAYMTSFYQERMAAMVGVFVRNYRGAIMIPLLRAIQWYSDGFIFPSLVCIPDFCVGDTLSVPKWEASKVFGWLNDLVQQDTKVVIGVESITLVQSLWGPNIYEYINTNFVGLD